MAKEVKPLFYRHQKIKDLSFDAEDMAIKAHDNLISLGYGEEIEPLRLPNRRGALAIFLASITAILYGVGGFIFGLDTNTTFQSSEFFFHVFDGLTLSAVAIGVLALISGILGLLKKHGSKIPSCVSFVILITAPLVLHIIGVAIGLMIP